VTPIVVALLREREHYQRRNLPERAAAVTAELARHGHVETAEAVPPPRPPASTPETTTLQAPPETAVPPRPQPRGKPHGT